MVDPALAAFGKQLGDYKAFYLLVPEEFDLIRIMLATKFVELFARRIAAGRLHLGTVQARDHRRAETPKELFLAFGRENTTFGKERLHIPLPDRCTYPGIMSVGYYVIGKLQAQKPAWFKKSVASFAKRASKAFNQKIEPIVKFK